MFSWHIYTQIFDTDGDGYITVDEMLHVLRIGGTKITEHQMKEAIKLFDFDHDGKLNYGGIVFILP